MSLSKSFYYGVFIKAMVEADVSEKDNIKVVFQKLKSTFEGKDISRIISFVKKNWSTERKLLATAVNNFKTSITPGFKLKDPALIKGSATVVRLPTQKMIVSDETLFSACPQCNGRTFPGFNLCPYCGYSLSQPPQNPEPLLPLSPSVPMTDANNMSMGGPSGGTWNQPAKPVSMPRSQPVGPLGKGIGINANSNSPKVIEIDGIVVTEADVNQEMATIHKYIPSKKKIIK